MYVGLGLWPAAGAYPLQLRASVAFPAQCIASCAHHIKHMNLCLFPSNDKPPPTIKFSAKPLTSLLNTSSRSAGTSSKTLRMASIWVECCDDNSILDPATGFKTIYNMRPGSWDIWRGEIPVTKRLCVAISAFSVKHLMSQPEMELLSKELAAWIAEEEAKLVAEITAEINHNTTTTILESFHPPNYE